MANKYLDNDGVLYLWNKIKALVSGAVPTKTSDLTNDSGFITSADIPSYPSMATDTSTSDWTTGKVVDAAVLKTVVYDAISQIGGKADASTTYTKTEVDNAIGSAVTNMYKYKGSVAAVSNLPSSNNTTGDVYNVEATGMNYAWNGTAWDALGEIFTITAITNSELDTICV